MLDVVGSAAAVSASMRLFKVLVAAAVPPVLLIGHGFGPHGFGGGVAGWLKRRSLHATSGIEAQAEETTDVLLGAQVIHRAAPSG
ncbi:hypothetical protein ADL25_34045 [Streptomyces sp. NRRL F-5122]|uniref:hypothetical protein n=1 Tax=Streptomyces sp. NRRL F-5122 TaxID=1609098 RepID=UPI0007411567|nr:hypothetical protein [Streptomyces sp. NRRL F-5122]KUJ36151.1 hypothetical protein ADL25_34045 [Streptomyces sp. NRRL F-5122]